MAQSNGIRRDAAYSATDDLGYAAVENPVHIHDFHATMLHRFGIEHTKLTGKKARLSLTLTLPAGREFLKTRFAL